MSLGFLIRLFPAGFRERFGAEMAADIEQEYGHARARGRWAATGFTVVTMLDLVRSALAERWIPTWVARGGPATERKDMRQILDEWGRDLRLAFRALKRSPGFALVTVGTLGLAIGANAGMFSVVDTVMMHPFPYPAMDRLVYIAATAPGSELPAEFGVASEFYVQYRERSRLLEDVSTYNSFTSTLRTEDRVERIRMSAPTNTLFSTLGATPILGRPPVAEDSGQSWSSATPCGPTGSAAIPPWSASRTTSRAHSAP